MTAVVALTNLLAVCRGLIPHFDFPVTKSHGKGIVRSEGCNQGIIFCVGGTATVDAVHFLVSPLPRVTVKALSGPKAATKASYSVWVEPPQSMPSIFCISEMSVKVHVRGVTLP